MTWRSMVLYMPAVAIVMGMFIVLMPKPNPDGTISAEELEHMAVVFPIVWLVMMGGIGVAGGLGTRWMLKKQRWADFFVALIPARDPREEVAAEE